MILFSIITINKNNALGLHKTIESVVNQSYKNFEFIVIDGDSSDHSVEIIKKFRDKITYWISEPDKGIYNAMNNGIRIAKGEYCLFLNSGDYLKNDNVLSEVFLHTISADIVSGNAVFLESKYHGEKYIYSPESIKASDLVLNFLPHQSSFIKRKLFSEIHFYDESVKITADWSFFIECLLMHSKTYQKINVFVSCYDTSGISSQESNMFLVTSEQELFLKKYLPLFYADFMELATNRTFYHSTIFEYYQSFKDSFIFKIYFLIRKKIMKTRYFELKAKIKKNIQFMKFRYSDYTKKNKIDKSIYLLPTDIFPSSTSGENIIVSLTSYGHRLKDSAPYAIYSIFTQNVLPNKIVLYLNEQKWNNRNLPILIKRLQKSGLEIIFCEDVGPHTKLIPALHQFPNDIIITVDDDVIYHKNTLKQLIELNIENKDSIICHKAVIPEKEAGSYIPYSKWNDDSFGSIYSQLSPLGVGGVLYPPHIFSEEIFNKTVYQKYCPIADDLWFWIIGLKSNVTIKKVLKSDFVFEYVDNLEQLDGKNSNALYFKNCLEGKNDEQFKNLTEYYKI